jgi:hypothetical protein
MNRIFISVYLLQFLLLFTFLLINTYCGSLFMNVILLRCLLGEEERGIRVLTVSHKVISHNGVTISPPTTPPRMAGRGIDFGFGEIIDVAVEALYRSRPAVF